MTINERQYKKFTLQAKHGIKGEAFFESIISDYVLPYHVSGASDLGKDGNFLRKTHIGNIWQRRFYTRIINNRKYLETVIYYIKQNAIKDKLPKKYHKPPYQYFNWKLIERLFYPPISGEGFL